MSETKKTGGCHCGRVRYEAQVDLTRPVVTCNCSMCGKSGTMLAFVPEAAFTLMQGEDALFEYRFHKKVLAHQFCKHCGIKSFIPGAAPDGTKIVAINVRTLDDIELDGLAVHAFDGKRL